MLGVKDTPYDRSYLKNKNVYAYAWDNVWEWGQGDRAYKLANADYKVDCFYYLLYLSVSMRGMIGQFWEPYFTASPAKFESFLSRAPD